MSLQNLKDCARFSHKLTQIVTCFVSINFDVETGVVADTSLLGQTLESSE